MRVQEASRGYSRKLGCTGVEVNVLACSIAAGDRFPSGVETPRPHPDSSWCRLHTNENVLSTNISWIDGKTTSVSVGGRGHRRHPHTSSMDGMSPCWSYWTNVTAEIQTHLTRKHFQSAVVQSWSECGVDVCTFRGSSSCCGRTEC